MLGDGSKACPLLGRTFKSMPGFFSKHCGGLQTLCRCPIDAVETIIPLLTTMAGTRARVRARLFAFWRGCWGTGQKHARCWDGRSKACPMFSKHCGDLQTLFWCLIDVFETIIPLLTTTAGARARVRALVCSCFLARVLGTQTVWGPTKRYLGLQAQLQQ